MVRRILTTIVAAATLSGGVILATEAPAATPLVTVTKPTTATTARPAATTTTKAFNLTDLGPAVKYIQGFTTTTHTHKSAPTTRPATPAKQPAITQTAQDIPKTSGCVWASKIREVWTQDAEWAIWVISKRGSWGTGESNCQAGAKNGSSSASGLFQMTKVHTARLVRVCTAENERRAAAGLPLIAISFFDGECNIRAAWDLYIHSGRDPWKL